MATTRVPAFGVVIEQLEARTLLSSLPTDVVSIPDAALLSAVRTTLNKPTGDITVADMQSLTVLNADNLGIANLQGLQYASNLQDLEVGDNQISDLTPLAADTSLDRLFLYNNHVSDVSPLSGLTNLTSLYLGANQITDVRPLAGLTNLIVLYLVDDQVSDITPLANLTQLSTLILGGNRLTDISTVQNFKNLQYLEINQNSISNLAPVAGLSHLLELMIYGNQITDLTPIAGLTNLDSLTMQNNQVTSLAPITSLTKLTTLDAADNLLADLSPIASFTQLKTVDVTNNNLDISAGSATMQIINTLTSRGASVQYSPQGSQVITPPPAVPATPTNVLLTVNDWPRTIAISWSDSSSQETGYLVQRSTDGSSYSQIAALAANTTSFTDSTATVGGTYYYKVAATGAQGDSPFTSAQRIFLPGTPPRATSFTASDGAGQVNLSWSDVSTLETSYVVRRSTDGINYIRLATLPANTTAYADNTVAAGVSYYYQLKAANSFGRSPFATAFITYAPAPRPAANLHATPTASTHSIALSWSDPSGIAATFSIRRSTDGVHFTTIAFVPGSATTYTDTGLSTGTMYYYRIRTLSSNGNSLSAIFWTPWA